MAGVGHYGGRQDKESYDGTPHGGVVSPLLSNIYLKTMDMLWEKKFKHLGELIRYADDCVPRKQPKCA